MEILSSISLFLVAFSLNVIFWRIKKPLNIGKYIILIFVCVMIFYILGLLLLKFEITGYFIIKTLILYMSFFSCYIMTYPVFAADSPSLIIADIVKNSNRGISYNKLLNSFDNSILLHPRIRDLLEENYIKYEKDKYKLTAKGKILSDIFINYRKIINRNKFGG